MLPTALIPSILHAGSISSCVRNANVEATQATCPLWLHPDTLAPLQTLALGIDSFLVTSRCGGTALQDVPSGLKCETLPAVAATLGSFLARVHQLPLPP